MYNKIAALLNNYSNTNPILPSWQSHILRKLILDLSLSNKSAESMLALVKAARINLHDQVVGEVLNNTDTSFINFVARGFFIFKNPVFLAVLIESVFWLDNNKRANAALNNWGLKTEFEEILEKCELELTGIEKTVPKINWHKVGFYSATAMIMALTAVQTLSSEAEPIPNLTA